MDKLEFIKSIKALSGFSEKSAKQVADIMEYFKVKPGEVIFQEGDPSDYLYIVADGEASVIKKLSHQNEKVLSVLNEKDIFGEMSLFSKKNRTASVTAKNNFSYYRIQTDAFNKILASDPAGAQNMLETLLLSSLERLEQTSRELATVYEISRLAARNLPFNEFCQETIKELCFSVPEVDSGTFFVWNEFTQDYEPLGVYGENKINSSIPANHNLIYFIEGKTETKALVDKESLNNVFGSDIPRVKSVLLVPLIKSRLLGFIMLSNSNKNVIFQQGISDLLNSVSSQLSGIIENMKAQQEKMDKDRLDRARGSVNW